MTISAGMVKDLRERTGAGMMECKKVLEEAGGDMEKAIVLLRERGMSRAAKKAGRTAAEGLVEVMISGDGSYGVVIEVNCETDFAAKNEDFVKFVKTAAKVALDKKAPSIEALAELHGPNGQSMGQNLTDLIAKVGENMQLRRLQLVTTKNGIVGSYNHMGGKICTLVAIEGDKSAKAAELAKDIAMHAAAAAPRYLNPAQVDPAELEQERQIARKRLLEEGKPAEMVEKIMVGQIAKFYKEVCLLEQIYVKDNSLTVTKLLKNSGMAIELSTFTRFQLGEGIEKKQTDFAAEVAATIKGS
jgi:elongation factor Ts